MTLHVGLQIKGLHRQAGLPPYWQNMGRLTYAFQPMQGLLYRKGRTNSSNSQKIIKWCGASKQASRGFDHVDLASDASLRPREEKDSVDPEVLVGMSCSFHGLSNGTYYSTILCNPRLCPQPSVEAPR